MRRRPESPFGWIVSAYGVMAACEGSAIGYAIAAARPDAAWLPGEATAAAWLGSWIGLVAGALLTLALLLVPDGRAGGAGGVRLGEALSERYAETRDLDEPRLRRQHRVARLRGARRKQSTDSSISRSHAIRTRPLSAPGRSP